MIKLSSSIKLTGLAVATVLLAGGGVALATSVVPAALNSPAASHSADQDDSKSGQGKQDGHGTSGDDCDGKALATAKPATHPTGHESDESQESAKPRPTSHPSVHESEKPDMDNGAKSGDDNDADEQCGNGQHHRGGDDCDADKTTAPGTPRVTTTPSKSDDEGRDGTGRPGQQCQAGQHGPDTGHGQAQGPNHSTGQTGDDQHQTTPHPSTTSGDHSDR